MSVDSSNNYSQRVIAGPRVESIATKIGTKAHFHSFERLMANSLYFCVKGASILCACACHYVQKTNKQKIQALVIWADRGSITDKLHINRFVRETCLAAVK